MDAAVRVLGVGNVLMADDGLGPFVVHELERHYTFPEGVAVVDVGTPGGDLLPFLHGAELIILVDTVKDDGAPGEVRLYDKAAILKHPPGVRVSPHDPGLKEALLSLEFGGGAPAEVLLVGVIPKAVEQGNALTTPVGAAVPGAMAEVVAELTRRGLAPTPKDPPEDVRPWWL